MKNPTRSAIFSSLLAVAIGLPAVALGQHGQQGPSGGPSQNKRDFGRSHAPEFDATVAGAIGAVIAGGGIILARRRRKS